MTDKHTIEYDVERARLYKALALAFDRPGAEPVAITHRETLASQFVDAAERLDELTANTTDQAADHDELAERAETVVEALPSDGREARSTYADAFGVEGEGTVSQYEVTYAPGTLVTNTDRIADVAGFYRAFGLDLSEDERDRADALPTQLEFCQHLALSRAVLATDRDEEGVGIVTDATASFLEDHLGRWLPRFVDEVRDEVDEAFYHALVDLLEALIAMDVAHFEVEPDEFDETPTAPLESLSGLERDEHGRLEMTCGGAPDGDAPGCGTEVFR